MDDKIYRRIVKRMEAGKIPIYPGIIRKRAITQYKAEKRAELRQKQREYEQKIREEQRRRERARQRAEWEAKWGEKEAQVKPGGWVRINPDGSVSHAGFPAFSPSKAKTLGYKWGTTLYTKDKIIYVPLPLPTEAEFYGIRKWKHEKGQYAHDPAIEKRIRKEVEIGGEKYGITAPAWAGGYLREYEKAAKSISQAYKKAVESQKTPSGYELREITLGKEGKGLRFGYISKPPPLRKPPVESKPTTEPTLVAPKKGMPTAITLGPLGRKIKEEGMPTVLLQTKKLRHPTYMMGTVTAIPEVRKPGVVSTFLGIPARKQKKVVEKELKDVQTIESKYIEKGWIKPVLPIIKSEDIGKIEIIGEYKDKRFAKPTPQLEMQFVGSPEYQSQLEKVKKIDVGIKPYVKEGVYTSPVVTVFEEKWNLTRKVSFLRVLKNSMYNTLKREI